MKQGKLPGKGKVGEVREMPKSTNPNETAYDFATKSLGRKPNNSDIENGKNINNGNCNGCWQGISNDNTMVIYRPAGNASSRTDNTTATVELNSTNIKSINNSKQLKLKFPKE